MTIREMLAKRAKVVEDFRAVALKDDPTPEERVAADKMEVDIDTLTRDIERATRAEKMAKEIVPDAAAVEPKLDTEQRIHADRDKEHAAAYRAAFLKYATTRNGLLDLEPEERKILAAGETRAQSTTVGAGGYTIPQAFSNALEIALKYYGPMFNVADVVTTASGADMPWPTVNDTAQVGAILSENSTIPAQDATFSSVTLKAFMYTSKLIAVSWQLLQDSAFDFESVVGNLAGIRLGRILNTHFTTGSGGGTQPNGIVTAAASGKVGATGQTTTVIYDDIVDLVHSVDPAYRPGAMFMLNDASVGKLRKVRIAQYSGDTAGQPIWQPSLVQGAPDTILGYKYVVNNDVAVMAANAKSILFGEFKKYKIRRVKDATLVSLYERYADALQNGYFVYGRFEGQLIDAGTNPVKYYQNSAT